MSKTEYWWISVAGKPCEPAIYKNGVWFTLGCADPMLSNTFRTVARIAEDDIPLNSQQERNAQRRELYALRHQPHGYMSK